MVDVSIIIINYKSAQLVLDCVASVYQQTQQYNFEIILVDNNSQDDCEERVLSEYKEVRWLQMGYNAGLARANNAGIEIAKGEYVLLLNADTIVLDKAEGSFQSKFKNILLVLHGFDATNTIKINNASVALQQSLISFLSPESFGVKGTVNNLNICKTQTSLIKNDNSKIVIKY